MGSVIESMGFLGSPLVVALLVSLAVALILLALRPARPEQELQERMDGLLTRSDVIEDMDMRRPFASRALLPIAQRGLRALGRLAPQRSAERTQQMLVKAGEPGGLTALDFFGLRLLGALLFGVGYYLLAGRSLALALAVRNALLAALVGYMLPYMWLRRLVRRRQHEIVRALPDALDLMTVGVEAGLAFESAMLRVGEQWDNALSQELRRVVTEMRVGTARNVALQRLADRVGAPEISSFVAVLVQSSQLGVSIAEVLHSQAAQMRVRRRQRAEELARQAGVKMVFPLVFFVLPALFVAILGPAVPGLVGLIATMGG